MGTQLLKEIIEKFFNTPLLTGETIQKNDINLFTMKAGTSIFRAGLEDEVNKDGTINQNKIPHFFSNINVMLSYATHTTFAYEYVLTKDINLIKVDEKCMNFLNNNNVKNSSSFIQMMGYEMHINSRENQQKFAKDYIKNYETIHLEESYFEGDMRVDQFNRISVSAKDFEIFKALTQTIINYNTANQNFKIDGFYCPPMRAGQWNEENLFSLFHIFPEEIYLENSNDIIRVQQRNAFFPQNIIQQKGYIEYSPDENELSKRILQCIDKNKIYEESTIKNLFNIPIFILSLQLEYQHIYSLINLKQGKIGKIYFSTKVIDHDDDDVIDDDVTDLKLKDDENPFLVAPLLREYIFKKDFFLKELYTEIAYVITSFFIIDPNLFRNMPPKQANPETDGPFHDKTYDINGTLLKTEFNENLFIYSILNNDMKQNVSGLNNLLTSASQRLRYSDFFKSGSVPEEDVFHAVISGGALFGLYSYGDFRRQTKDIDLKIIFDSDLNDPERANEIYLWENAEQRRILEIQHMMATYIVWLWGNITQIITNDLVSYKIMYFKMMLLKNPNTYQLPDKHKDPQIKYVSSLGVSPTARIFIPEVEMEDALLHKFKNNNFKVIDEFDNYLKSEGNSYLSFYKARKSLLDEKVKQNVIINKNYVDEKKIKEQIAIIRSRTSTHEEKEVSRKIIQDLGNEKVTDSQINAAIAEKKNINIELKKFVTHFKNFFINNFQLQISEQNKNYIYDLIMNKIQKYVKEKRPFLPVGEHKFRVGDFMSLYVGQKGSEQHGLIDYTFDSYYSHFGKYTKPSGLQHNGYNDKDGEENIYGLLYASAYHFIYESNKLNKICDISTTYRFDNDLPDKNPFNACAPDPVNRQKKREKYQNRYIRVFKLYNEFAHAVYKSPNQAKEFKDLQTEIIKIGNINNFENFIQNVEQMPHREYFIKILTKYMIIYSTKKRGNEYFIGAGRKKRNQTRRRKTKTNKKSKKTRGSRK
jgi:hypothetical protein